MTDKPKKRTRFIVKKDNVPCGFILKKAFESKARGCSATLPDDPHCFSTEDAANHAIEVTKDAIRLVRGSMLDGWDKLAHLMEPGEFTVERTKK